MKLLKKVLWCAGIAYHIGGCIIYNANIYWLPMGFALCCQKKIDWLVSNHLHLGKDMLLCWPVLSSPRKKGQLNKDKGLFAVEE